jgi:hypothetical protein
MNTLEGKVPIEVGGGEGIESHQDGVSCVPEVPE